MKWNNLASYFIGMTINNKLTNYIKIIEKLSRTIGVFRRFQHIFPDYILILLYSSLLILLFHYCIPVWGTNLNMTIPLPKNILTTNSNNRFSHTEPISGRCSLLRLTMNNESFRYQNIGKNKWTIIIPFVDKNIF